MPPPPLKVRINESFASVEHSSARTFSLSPLEVRVTGEYIHCMSNNYKNTWWRIIFPKKIKCGLPFQKTWAMFNHYIHKKAWPILLYMHFCKSMYKKPEGVNFYISNTIEIQAAVLYTPASLNQETFNFFFFFSDAD